MIDETERPLEARRADGDAGGRPAGNQGRRRPQQRKIKRSNVNGWLILDKPVGMTSTEAVAAAKRMFNAAKAGHAGTLDPLASGCLPIAFGEATKTVPFVVDGRKVYRFTVRWGVETDTDDTEGKPVATSDARPTRAEIEALLPRFLGEISQVPPRYSAIKIAGERAYDLAREGEVVELEPRTVEIHRLAIVGQPDADHVEIEAECGKGTYVRALARDFGRLLGCYGHVSALRRLVVGPFDEEDLVPLAEVEEAGAHLAGGVDEEGRPTRPPAAAIAAARGHFLLPIEAALSDLPEITVDRVEAGRLMRGQSIILRGRNLPPIGETVYATTGGRLLALGEVERGSFVPRRVFHVGRPERGGGEDHC